MTKPKAVLIADVHFNINTLDVATAALTQALDKAEELDVPCIIAGDLHDTKANIRGEVVNRLISIFSHRAIDIFVIVGNHCRINEKMPEHSLNFLRPYVAIVDTPDEIDGIEMLPYYSDHTAFLKALHDIRPHSIVIMHQGVQGADMGHYIKDETSLPPETFADYRVISGHYHKRQDIKCGRPRKGAVGLFSYIGNPYTLTFGEANDPEKGYQILNDDGILTFVPTNLRRHRIFELNLEDLEGFTCEVNPDDLIWVKLHGDQMQLDKVDKRQLGTRLFGHYNYKLDKIPYTLNRVVERTQDSSKKPLDLLDAIVDANEGTAEDKDYLKTLARELLG